MQQSKEHVILTCYRLGYQVHMQKILHCNLRGNFLFVVAYR